MYRFLQRTEKIEKQQKKIVNKFRKMLAALSVTYGLEIEETLSLIGSNDTSLFEIFPPKTLNYLKL